MNILVTGGNSLLGKALWESAPDRKLLLTDLPQRAWNLPDQRTAVLDVTEPGAVQQLVMRFQPHVLIHLAALSDVDTCERDPRRAFAVNVEGTQNVIAACKENGTTLVFASSNGVFDGKHAPYSERSRPRPLYVYGKTKVQAEHRIRRAEIPYLTLRMMTLYGWPPPGARENPVTWAIDKLDRGETLHMVTDQFVNPLYALSAADAIWKLIEKNARGLFHLAGASRVSRFTWTKTAAKVFGYRPKLVKPVKSSFFTFLTPRPRDTTLKTEKLERTIDWKPLTVAEGLRNMLQARPPNERR